MTRIDDGRPVRTRRDRPQMFTAWGVMGWRCQGRDIFWHGADAETWTTQPWMTTATGHSCRVLNRAFWVDWHPKTEIRRRRCRDAALAFFAPLIEGDAGDPAPPRAGGCWRCDGPLPRAVRAGRAAALPVRLRRRGPRRAGPLRAARAAAGVGRSVTARCRSCFAYVVWATTTIAGERMPLDADEDGTPLPHPGPGLGDHRGARQGRIVPVAVQPSLDGGDEQLMVRVLDEDDPHQAEMWRSHFSSCPQADEWRRQRR